MANNFPLTALETKKCPPHHWFIDGDGMGRCIKCRKKQSFTPKESWKDNWRNNLYREKASNGGKIAQSRKRQNKIGGKKDNGKVKANQD